MRQYPCFPRHFSRLLAAGALATSVASGAPAQDVAPDDVIWLLRSEGYQVTEISRTLLGRIRIEATNGVFDREIILSRATGEIRYDGVYAKLRDTPPITEGESHAN